MAIPYKNIVISLSLIAVPCFIGIIVRLYAEKIAKTMDSATKKIAVYAILWLVIVGPIANKNIFPLLVHQWYIFPSTVALVYFGMTFGGIVTCILGQSKERIITIAIETGIQDMPAAMAILLFTFGNPDGVIAAAVPFAATLATPIPMAIITLLIAIRNKFCVEHVQDEGRSRQLVELQYHLEDTDTPHTLSTVVSSDAKQDLGD